MAENPFAKYAPVPAGAPSGNPFSGFAPKSRAELDAMRKASFDAATAPAEPAWYEKLGRAADDLVRSGANAMTFGYADKLAGALSGTGTEYERMLTQQARDRAGSAAIATDLGASVATAGGLAKAGLTALNLLPKAVAGSKAAQVAAMGVDGAGFGALDALGNDREIAPSAALGAAAGAAGGAVGQAIGGLLKKRAPAPSAESVETAANAAYRRADDTGVIVAPTAMQRLLADVQGELANFGYHPQLQPRIAPVLSEIERVGQEPITAKGIDVMRKIARSAAASQDPSERALGNMIVRKIDQTLSTLKPSDVISGNAQAASSAYTEARRLWQKKSKLEAVDDAATSAELRAASTGSGGNIDNATRQEFRKILDNDVARRGYTADELAAMEDIVRGRPTQNAMRLLGKLSPSGNGLMAALGLGATAANPLMAVVPAAGMVAKSAAERGTNNNVDRLRRIIAAGGDASAADAAPYTTNRLTEAQRDLLSRALFGGGFTVGVPLLPSSP